MSKRMVMVLVLDSDENPGYEDTTAALEALRGLVKQHLGKWQTKAGWLGTDRVDQVITAIGPTETGLDLLGRELLSQRTHPDWPEIGVNVRFYFDDADPCAQCECGWHTHGDAAVDAFSAWWQHLRVSSG